MYNNQFPWTLIITTNIKLMVISKNIKSISTFEEFLKQPEIKPAKEYFDGIIYQKPMPQGEHSILQMRLGTAINNISLPNKLAYQKLFDWLII